MATKIAIRGDVATKLPEEFCKIRGVDSSGYIKPINFAAGKYDRIDCHTDQAWLDWLEEHGGTWQEGYNRWDLVTLPDNVTDWTIYRVETNEDVWEDVAWVMDGKLHWFRDDLSKADD